jgi:hypothetical protein
MQRKDVKASDSDIRRMSGSSGPVGGLYGAKVNHERLGDHRQAGHHANRDYVSPLGGASAPYSTDKQKRQEARNRAQSLTRDR